MTSLSAVRLRALAATCMVASACGPLDGDADPAVDREPSPATAVVRQAVGSAPVLLAPQIQAPRDLVGDSNAPPDGNIYVCVDRTRTFCDYHLIVLPLGAGNTEIPLKGSVTIASAHVFDLAAVQALQELLTSGGQSGDPGSVTLTANSDAGTCGIRVTMSLAMSAFWNHVTFSADRKTLHWDLTEEDLVLLSNRCWFVRASALLTMHIPVPLLSLEAGTSVPASFTISNDPSVIRPDATLPPIWIVNA